MSLSIFKWVCSFWAFNRAPTVAVRCLFFAGISSKLIQKSSLLIFPNGRDSFIEVFDVLVTAKREPRNYWNMWKKATKTNCGIMMKVLSRNGFCPNDIKPFFRLRPISLPELFWPWAGLSWMVTLVRSPIPMPGLTRTRSTIHKLKSNIWILLFSPNE